MKIIDYQIVSGLDSADVSRICKTLMLKGWQPLQFQLSHGHTNIAYAQVMVKYELDDIKQTQIRYVEGKPADVEVSINSLLSAGWTLRGEPTTRDENGVTVVVQCMVNQCE